jgi:hypothetical protein
VKVAAAFMAAIYWYAFSFMVFYFAGYSQNHKMYKVLSIIAIAIIVGITTLDAYYYLRGI